LKEHLTYADHSVYCEAPSSTNGSWYCAAKSKLAKVAAATSLIWVFGAATLLAQSSIIISPENLAFGNQQIYASSGSRTIIVNNQQNVTLTFSSILTSGDFLQSNNCGSSIAANSRCTISVVFHPLALGPLSGTVALTDGATNSHQSVTLSGYGTPPPVTTYHYNSARTGANTSETILTPANVNMSQFGKLFSIAVDSYIFAQPLYVPNLLIPSLGTPHNVIYVATQHNWVYAFDADDGSTLWSVNLGPYQPKNTCSPQWDMGVLSTPVIDLATNTIYLDAAVLQGDSAVHQLHALDITSGAERPFSPVAITAGVPGTGNGSVGGVLTFTPLNQRQHLALLLDNGLIYIGFSSNCDGDLFASGHGWLFAYDKASLRSKGLFVSSPNGYGSGIWESGGGPAADGKHDIYFSTANGNFDVDQGGTDYGDSLLKLASNSFSLTDYFTPFNQATLESNDLDLGSGGITLLPDQATSPNHLMVTAGKEGRIYLLNRDNLGGYNSSVDNVVQEETGLGQMLSTPSFWNNTLYIVASLDYPKAYSFSGGHLSDNPVSQGALTYPYRGAQTVVSAKGATNGVLWAAQNGGTASGNEVLHAYAATNLAKELYNSDQAGTRDLPGLAARQFENIIVVNGKVYVPTNQPSLTVFGLLAGNRPL
jgi:outer membrane protein assembly factor BamB